MATVFKRAKKINPNGYYYIQWYDQNGKRQTKCAKTTDKATAERIANKNEADAALRREGIIDHAAARRDQHLHKPMKEHVADFKKDLIARQNTEKHVKDTIGNIEL